MDLRSLIAEKESIREKIEKLENIKGDIRDTVYNKIKSEYLESLDRVEAAIKENQTDVEEELKSIREEIKEVKELQEKYETEYEEINVRIQLGDYSEDEYGDKTNELKEQIETYKNRENELNAKIEELSNLMDDEKNDTIPHIEEEALPELEEPVEQIEEESIPEIGDDFEQSIEQSIEETIPDINPDAIEEENAENNESDFTQSMAPDDTKVAEEEDTSDNILENKPETPLNDILQPILEPEENEDDSGIETISNDMDGFLEDAEKEEEQSAIEGIECPKCHHINNPNLMNCEKCGAELF